MFELPPPYESEVSLFGSSRDLLDAHELLLRYGWNVTRSIDWSLLLSWSCSVLQCVAVRCSALECVLLALLIGLSCS